MTGASEDKDYLLGVNERELARLRVQHSVWGAVTGKLFHRLGVRAGWKCLDAGAGPGFASADLRERVGASGEVTLLEPSEFYLDHFKSVAQKNGWTNIRFLQGTVENTTLRERSYDFVFARWVISFAADPEEFLKRLFSALKPGGIIALQDYYYEGLSLYPRGGPFDRMADVVRAHYRSGGGDPYVAGVLPSIFRKHGLRLLEFSPNCLAGGPQSGVMEWAHRFFTAHVQAMVDAGNVSQVEGDAMLADWLAHRENPDMLFFSPLVVDVAGMQPG